MQQAQVRELIESIVHPLRQKINYLEKQNEQLKTQITTLHPHNSPQRLRSNSRQEHRLPKKEEGRQIRSPSLKKKDDKDKPVWNYGKVAKKQKGIYKSPPPVDKNKIKPLPPRSISRQDSKEKVIQNCEEKVKLHKQEENVKILSFEKGNIQEKKIMGGQKFSEPGSMNGSSKPLSNEADAPQQDKANPENGYSQENSSLGGSHLLPENTNSETSGQ